MRIAIIISLLFIIFSCQVTNQKEKNNTSEHQVRIQNVKKNYDREYQMAKNDIQRDAIQGQFDKWFSSYINDTINNRIDSFEVNISNLSSGLFFGKFYAIVADFKTDDELRIYEEDDVKTESEMKSQKVYKLIFNLDKNKKAFVSGNVTIGKRYSEDLSLLSGVRYPELYIELTEASNLQ